VPGGQRSVRGVGVSCALQLADIPEGFKPADARFDLIVESPPHCNQHAQNRDEGYNFCPARMSGYASLI